MSADTTLPSESDVLPDEPERRPLLDTERVSPRYADIDRWDPGDILGTSSAGQRCPVAAVRAAQPAVRVALAALTESLNSNKRL